jgi:FtsH-binding integral membrane protein
MSYFGLAFVSFAVMVYALLHSSLTTVQAQIIVGLAFVTTSCVFIGITQIMTRKLQELRGKLEILTAQSTARIATLKDLKEQVKTRD